MGKHVFSNEHTNDVELETMVTWTDVGITSYCLFINFYNIMVENSNHCKI